jgi:7,8-dihydroneopterin aldolase/epimerase/oxygenase
LVGGATCAQTLDKRGKRFEDALCAKHAVQPNMRGAALLLNEMFSCGRGTLGGLMQEGVPVNGRLTIRGLRCTGRHGSTPAQREIESTFLVDLSVRTDLEPAARDDDLSSTVDLAALAATVREIVGGPSRVLLETVVIAIARALLGRFPSLYEVRVHVRVPEPAGLDAAEEAIEVTLSRG